MDVTRISACSFPLREKDLDYTFKVISEAGFDKIDLVGRMPHFSVIDPDYDMDELRRVSRQVRRGVGKYRVVLRARFCRRFGR